jgi:hypothetical protein
MYASTDRCTDTDTDTVKIVAPEPKTHTMYIKVHRLAGFFHVLVTEIYVIKSA